MTFGDLKPGDRFTHCGQAAVKTEPDGEYNAEIPQAEGRPVQITVAADAKVSKVVGVNFFGDNGAGGVTCVMTDPPKDANG